MLYYNKLVRDKIPEIIRSNGENPIVRVMDDDEYISTSEAKLTEKCGSLAEELTQIYERKYAERGGFEEKIFLIGKE